MTAVFGEPYIRALFIEAFERHDERIKKLEASILSSFVASSAEGVAAGISYVRSLADQGVTALKEFADWAANLVGVSPDAHLIKGPVDAERMLLITELIETIPEERLTAASNPKHINKPT